MTGRHAFRKAKTGILSPRDMKTCGLPLPFTNPHLVQTRRSDLFLFFLTEDHVHRGLWGVMAVALRSSLRHLARLSAAPARGVVSGLLGPSMRALAVRCETREQGLVGDPNIRKQLTVSAHTQAARHGLGDGCNRSATFLTAAGALVRGLCQCCSALAHHLRAAVRPA